MFSWCHIALQCTWCQYAELSVLVCLLCVCATLVEMVFANVDW